MSTDYLTVADVSERLNISVDAVYMRRQRGTFPAPDIDRGKILLWKPETIDDWVQRKGHDDNVGNTRA